jgi:hypothetical protein
MEPAKTNKTKVIAKKRMRPADNFGKILLHPNR